MGLSGLELGSNVNGRSLGMPEFREFFQEAERLDIAIFVHALHPTMLDRLSSASQANPIGFPIDTALTIASLIDGGTAEQCPGLRLAFSHGGGTFPFQLPRYHHQWSGTWNEGSPAESRSGSLPRSPFEYARRFYYDTLLFDRRAIRYLIDTIGHRQVMIGTDYPYMAPEVPADKSLRSLRLADADHDDITWNNAFRFLGVEAPVPA
jgi:aminocarboxymuconate-semialdehyde decarboxylase